MEVITVADGRSAFEKMVQVVPDLVLADVYMPEVDGYELCRSIKQDERFAKTPVMLLISSFEPFDEAEARLAGADDVVTKPFQSIRQLVSRVGSLLNKGAIEPQVTDEYPLMEMSHTEPIVPAAVEELPSEPQLKVLVEAPIMEHVEPAEPAGVACSADVELQTADTMKLERVVDELGDPAGDNHLTMADTIEVVPVEAIVSDDSIQVEPEPESIEVSYASTFRPVVQAAPPPPMKMDDAVLDLEDEFLDEPEIVDDDVFLDLDFADTVPAESFQENVAEVAPAIVAQDVPAVVAEGTPAVVVEEFPTVLADEELMVVAEEVPTPMVLEPTNAQQAVELEQPSSPVMDEAHVLQKPEESSPGLQSFPSPSPEPAMEPLPAHGVEGLSPAAIDAIARRMVEQMSDRVIREIAWEVIPELSELLIKQKLEEQK